WPLVLVQPVESPDQLAEPGNHAHHAQNKREPGAAVQPPVQVEPGGKPDYGREGQGQHRRTHQTRGAHLSALLSSVRHAASSNAWWSARADACASSLRTRQDTEPSESAICMTRMPDS